MLGDAMEIAVLQVEEFVEEVLDFDVVMSTGEAETGGAFEGFARGVVRFRYQGF
jgi:hypothetical protein